MSDTTNVQGTSINKTATRPKRATRASTRRKKSDDAFIKNLIKGIECQLADGTINIESVHPTVMAVMDAVVEKPEFLLDHNPDEARAKVDVALAKFVEEWERKHPEASKAS